MNESSQRRATSFPIPAQLNILIDQIKFPQKVRNGGVAPKLHFLGPLHGYDVLRVVGEPVRALPFPFRQVKRGHRSGKGTALHQTALLRFLATLLVVGASLAGRQSEVEAFRFPFATDLIYRLEAEYICAEMHNGEGMALGFEFHFALDGFVWRSGEIMRTRGIQTTSSS